MSDEPAIVIRLDGDRLVFQPGEHFSGQYWIDSLGDAELRAVEASVLWYTEGKGDEDMAVHAFWRRDADNGIATDPGRPERFSTVLPNSPLSYEGQIVKLRWCLRLRYFLGRGKEIVGEKAFQLGSVSPIRQDAAR